MKQQQLTVGREAHRGVFQMPVVLENETTRPPPLLPLSALSKCPGRPLSSLVHSRQLGWGCVCSAIRVWLRVGR